MAFRNNLYVGGDGAVAIACAILSVCVLDRCRGCSGWVAPR
jgi:hypothetical protein